MLDKFFKTISRVVPEKWQWVLTHEGFKRYFANTGWMFFGQMFSMLVSFFIGAWVARYLGPGNFGLMSYSISFVSLFGFLVGFGVDSILSRELIKAPEKKDELLGTSFWMKLIGGLTAIIIINVISLFVNQDFLSRLLVFVFSFTFIFQSFNVISNFFQSQIISKKIVQVQIVVSLFSVLIKILFIYLNLGVVWITSVYLVDGIILAIGFVIIYYKKEKKLFKISIDKNILKTLLKDSLPLMFSVIALTVYGKIDQVIIGKMLNETAVGVYAVAVKISEVWYFIPGLICTSLFPAIINAKKTDIISYKKRMKALYSFLIYSGLFVSIIIFFFSGPVIRIVFGQDYIASIKISQIYAWSGVSMFLMTGFWTYLLSENYTKIYLFATIFGAVSNILLNIILIPVFGVMGSAYATLISYSLPPFSLIFFRKTREQIFLAFKSIIVN